MELKSIFRDFSGFFGIFRDFSGFCSISSPFFRDLIRIEFKFSGFFGIFRDLIRIEIDFAGFIVNFRDLIRIEIEFSGYFGIFRDISGYFGIDCCAGSDGCATPIENTDEADVKNAGCGCDPR